MKAQYSINALPLGNYNSESRQFNVHLISKLSFPASAQLDRAFARRVIELHPVLSAGVERTLTGVIWTYNDWHSKPLAQRVEVARVRLRAESPLTGKKDALADLIGLRGTEPSVVNEVRHSSYVDKLGAEHYVEVGAALDAMRRLSGFATKSTAPLVADLRPSDAVKLSDAEFANWLQRVDVDGERWVAACVQATVLRYATQGLSKAEARQLSGDESLADEAAACKRAWAKLERMQLPPVGGFGFTRENGLPATPNDVNLVLQASLKNQQLSRRCGFVTQWIAEVSSSIPKGVPLVFQLTGLELAANGDAELEMLAPTAFMLSTHIHPASVQEISAGAVRTGGLACLNEARRLRYHVSSVRTKHELTKSLLQANNTFGDPESYQPRRARDMFRDPVDKRAPNMLRQQQFGVPEPDTSGIIVSAPLEDLITPPQLVFDTPEQRKAAIPCLFLEDLWIGYRLDLKAAAGNRFTSTHRHEEVITLASGTRWSEWTEDLHDREQVQDPKFGHSSSERIVYTGLSRWQKRDLLEALGECSLPDVETFSNSFYSAQARAYGETEPLEFGHTYDYRLRNVFTGGVSLNDSEADSVSDSSTVQSFPFFRAAALKPGEVIPAGAEQNTPVNVAEVQSIYISSAQRKADFFVVPSPLDLESARFHGMLFRNEDELRRQRNRRVIRDMSKALAGHAGDVDYFCDPDVYAVVFRAKVLNGSAPLNSEGVVVDGSRCELRPHMELPPVVEHFGKKGEWESFRSIRLTIVASATSQSRLKARGWFDGCRHVELEVAPGHQVELSLLPVFDPKLLGLNATSCASSTELGVGVRPADTLVPILAARQIAVSHAVSLPLRDPLLHHHQSGGATTPSGSRPAMATKQAGEPTVALLKARVEVDPATSKEMWVEAAWSDVLPGSVDAGYISVPASMATERRNLVFEKHEPPAPTLRALRELLSGKKAVAKYYGFQRSETDVYLEGDAVSDAVVRIDRLKLPDARRRLVDVRVATSGRYGNVAGLSAAQSRASSPIRFDVANASLLTPPSIAYVIPLKRDLKTSDGTHAAEFAMRFYLRDGPAEMGIGGRIAIACSGSRVPDASTMKEVPKHVTQWGEDPVQRPKLALTRRVPHASDFTTAQPVSVVNSRLDRTLYPEYLEEGGDAVIYSDWIELATPVEATKGVSVASFALRFDRRQGLWFFDAAVRSHFFGWCGLALYRHQPNSIDRHALSPAAAWVYMCVLYQEPFTVVRSGSMCRVTVGPVFEESVKFKLEVLGFEHGISTNLNGLERQQIEMQSRKIGRATYYQGEVAFSKNLQLVKLRFDEIVRIVSVDE